MFNFYYDGLKNDYMVHADHKYIDKFFKNGRWNYVYKNPLKGLVSTHERITDPYTGKTYERTDGGAWTKGKPKKKLFSTHERITDPYTSKTYERTDGGAWTKGTPKKKLFSTHERIVDPDTGNTYERTDGGAWTKGKAKKDDPVFRKVEIPQAYKNANEANRKGIRQTEYYKKQQRLQKSKEQKKEASKSKIDRLRDRAINNLSYVRSKGKAKLNAILKRLKR